MEWSDRAGSIGAHKVLATSDYSKFNQSGQSAAKGHKAASQLTDDAKKTQQQAYDTVVDVVTAPFDFFLWITQNWQLAILGGLAIYIIIKD